MSEIGVRTRLERIGRDGSYLIVPMDHGITIGPVSGLVDPGATVAAVSTNGADAIVTHRGLAARVTPHRGDAGYIVHLNASTDRGPNPNDKRLVCSVETAIAHGADAVSFHLNVGSDREPEQLVDLGSVIESAHRYGLPVLAMAYPRGPDVDSTDPTATAHAVRVADELGADLIKTSVPASDLEVAVGATDRPVLIAGGSPSAPIDTLEMIADAMDAGAAGVSMGRSIFQHPSPGRMTAAIAAIVHDGASAGTATEHLGN